jgi:transcriptional regulator with XRE-family HTH domain
MISITREVPDYATNLHRLMAREGLTLAELGRRSKLNHFTLKRILKGNRRPQARTLHRLAASLNVPVEELYQDPALLRHRLFDRYTNPVVDELVRASPRLFHGWSSAEFGELYSRFGTGGSLTLEGAHDAVRSMNRRRELLAKVTLLWETGDVELLETMIEVLYRRASISTLADINSKESCRTSENCNSVSDVAGSIVGDAQPIGRASSDVPTSNLIQQQ